MGFHAYMHLEVLARACSDASTSPYGFTAVMAQTSSVDTMGNKEIGPMAQLNDYTNTSEPMKFHRNGMIHFPVMMMILNCHRR